MRKKEFGKTLEIPVYTIMCTHKDGTITFYDDWCSFPNIWKDNPVYDPNLPNGFILPKNKKDCEFGSDYPFGYWGKDSNNIIEQRIIRKRIFDIPESIINRFDAYCEEQCG